MFACNGILFNHESPIRGETFVTRKITLGLANVVQGNQPGLFLGNLDARRDWGHARDYVEAQWMMLQQDQPEDYVIATGKQHSVRDFVTAAASEIGITMEWQGSGADEVGIVADISRDDLKVKKGDRLVAVDRKYYRPAEVETLLGDASKAEQKLGWKPRTSFTELVSEMMHSDMRKVAADKALNRQLNKDA